MVLIMSFVTGIALQLKNKLEALELGLGKQMLKDISFAISPSESEVIEKLSKK